MAMPAHHDHPEHAVDIKVNTKNVSISPAKTTGLGIKEAAIAQGVQIELSFQLSEELPNRRKKIIGDNEHVTVHDDEKFIAVADDDNS
jgi:Multiubiquitin